MVQYIYGSVKREILIDYPPPVLHFLAPEAYSLASQERWCGAGCPDAVYEVMSNYGIVDPASREI